MDDAKEKHLTAVSALGTFLTGISAPFTNSYKIYGYLLFVLSSILFLIIFIVRVRGVLPRRHLQVPLISTVILVCFISMGLAAISLRRTPPGNGSQLPAGATTKSTGSSSTSYSIQTGNESPVATGDGANITVNHDDKSGKKSSKKQSK